MGLYQVFHRWYDPTIGRWISKDPMSFDAGDSDLYRYVGNNSSNFTDPSGKQAQMSRRQQLQLSALFEALKKRWRQDSQYAGSGERLFRLKNMDGSELKHELTFARDKKVRRIQLTTKQDLVKGIGREKVFKWVVTPDGKLWAVKLTEERGVPLDEIKHTVASNGAEWVLVAGMGKIRKDGSLEIDPNSGHYSKLRTITTRDVTQRAKPKFEQLGLEVDVVSRVQPRPKRRPGELP